MKELEDYLEKIELTSKEYIKKEVENYMYIKYPQDDYKVVCDDTNNGDKKYTHLDVYIRPHRALHYTVNRITIQKNPIKELRKLRKKKINSLYK